MASTPRYWSESDPYFSLTIAKAGSRSSEKVAPMVALPIRSSTASGRASATVPSRCPISCSSSAGPACSSVGMFGPMLKASRATRNSTATPTNAFAMRWKPRPTGRIRWKDRAAAMRRPHTIGKKTMEEDPSGRVRDTITWATSAITRAATATGATPRRPTMDLVLSPTVVVMGGPFARCTGGRPARRIDEERFLQSPSRRTSSAIAVAHDTRQHAFPRRCTRVAAV